MCVFLMRTYFSYMFPNGHLCLCCLYSDMYVCEHLHSNFVHMSAYSMPITVCTVSKYVLSAVRVPVFYVHHLRVSV